MSESDASSQAFEAWWERGGLDLVPLTPFKETLRAVFRAGRQSRQAEIAAMEAERKRALVDMYYWRDQAEDEHEKNADLSERIAELEGVLTEDELKALTYCVHWLRELGEYHGDPASHEHRMEYIPVAVAALNKLEAALAGKDTK